MLPQLFNYRVPSLGRTPNLGKQNRAKSTTTYAFLLKIVSGASYQHDDEIETVALFNESCNRNYVSSQFARNRLRIINNNNTDDEFDGDYRLVWICEGLGRYRQRTVFWVAKDADFDLLFGYEDDQNTLDHQDQQFQNGINNGTLKTELWKSFQGGIKDDYLLPVGRVAGGDHPSNHLRMPSLADIKKQLAVQLDSSLERKEQYEREKALNTFDPRHINDQEDFFCGEDPNDSTTPVIIAIPRQEKFKLLDPLTPAIEASKQQSNQHFKGNKRTLHEYPRALTSGELEDFHRSPKIRNVGATCSSPCIAANLSMDEIPLRQETFDDQVTSTFSDINSLAVVSVGERPATAQSPKITGATSNDSFLRQSNNGTEEELLFSGMDRIDSSCMSVISHKGSTISLSSKNFDTKSISWDYSATPDILEKIPQSKRKKRRNKRKRRSKVIGNPQIATPDCTDQKFHEFWKKDEENGNLYHVDEVTDKVTWYEAPPWSISSSAAEDRCLNSPPLND